MKLILLYGYAGSRKYQAKTIEIPEKVINVLERIKILKGIKALEKQLKT
ncbi:hypothetical protein [Methanosarcina barkeri]|nr:hypothetical protein [Methanosarcina barkeri]